MSEISVNLASRWRRLGGALIDALVVVIVFFVPLTLFPGEFLQILGGREMTLGQQVILSASAWVVFLVLNVYLISKRGQTIGKVFVRTRIIDLDGNIPKSGKLVVLRYRSQV